MKNGIGLICALLLWSPASNAEWELLHLSAENRNRYFVDWDTLQVTGDVRKVWLLVELESPARDARSWKVLEEYDCADDRLRIAVFSMYDGPMGTGELLDSAEGGEWSDVVPGTLGAANFSAVCDR